MQTIGERLEEARKRRGISIREASEATKIRGDYLAGFEGNSFDIKLPEIYVRGFLRAYACFLKLNPEKLITDYNAYRLGESKIVRRDSRESLGRMDIPDREPPAENHPAERASHPPPQEQASQDREAKPVSFPRFSYIPGDRATLLKVVAVVAGAGMLMALIVFLVLAVIRTDPTTQQVAEGEAATGIAAQPLQRISLMAQGGDIGAISITEVGTNRLLYRGPLANGESRFFETTQRIRVTSTDLQHLVIEHAGAQMRPGRSGPGSFSFPPTQ